MNYKKLNLQSILFQSIVLMCLLCPVLSWADNDQNESVRLIQSYLEALKSEDAIQIKSVWNELNENPEALEYMRLNMPKLNYLFQVKGLYFKSQEIENERLLMLDKSTLGSADGASSTFRKKYISKLSSENKKFSLSQASFERPRTNGDIVALSQGIKLPDNRDVALLNPNQNRRDNETLIRDRARSFVETKFQKSSGELAPRGNVFEPVSQRNGPIVKVFDFSTGVSFSQFSRAPFLVDVYVNDQLVVAGLKVMKTSKPVKLYLQPGANMLKFSLSRIQEKEVLSPRTIIAVFSKTSEGVQKLSWELTPENAQTLRIEVLPK